MDYRVYHAVNELAVDDKWLAHATSLLLERISDPVVAPFHSWWQRRSLPTPQP